MRCWSRYGPSASRSVATVVPSRSRPGGSAYRAGVHQLNRRRSRLTRRSASYFIPDNVVVNSLVAALKRGVRVQIIRAGPHMDMPLVRRASCAGWGKLLAAGAPIFEYQPTMFHCKVIVVDGLWVSVGSTNFDTRSFSINDEANLNVHDASFARRADRGVQE